jgi:hypothetical protein
LLEGPGLGDAAGCLKKRIADGEIRDPRSGQMTPAGVVAAELLRRSAPRDDDSLGVSASPGSAPRAGRGQVRRGNLDVAVLRRQASGSHPWQNDSDIEPIDPPVTTAASSYSQHNDRQIERLPARPGGAARHDLLARRGVSGL